MDAEQLRDLQAPLKARYRDEPDAAVITLKAEGRLDGDGITCKVDTGRALVEAGLHPATGGDGLSACSGDMLLEALVACTVSPRAAAFFQRQGFERVAPETMPPGKWQGYEPARRDRVVCLRRDLSGPR